MKKEELETLKLSVIFAREIDKKQGERIALLMKENSILRSVSKFDVETIEFLRNTE